MICDVTLILILKKSSSSPPYKKYKKPSLTPQPQIGSAACKLLYHSTYYFVLSIYRVPAQYFKPLYLLHLLICLCLA